LPTLKEQAEADINLFMETGLPWVDQAVFTPQTGDPVSLNVIFEQDQDLEFEGYENRSTELKYRIESLIADLGQIPIAATTTRNGDIFTINSVEYEVTAITDQDNFTVTCAARIR
jgi:hypothetical protein